MQYSYLQLLLEQSSLEPTKLINSSAPNATYMHPGTGSASGQIMACCLFGANPLSEPALGYCPLDPKE